MVQSDRIAAPTQFTCQSHNLTACPPSRRASWLVLQRRMLTASDFHEICRLQTDSDMPSERSTSKAAKLVYSHYSCYVYVDSGCSGLSCTSAKHDRGWPAAHPAKDHGNCLWSRLWVVCHRHRLLRRHNYRVPPSVCHLLVADLPHLDQLSWTHIRALDSTTMAVWFSCNALASINVVVLRQTRLVWVFSPLASTWPHLRSDVGLEEWEYWKKNSLC